MPVSLSSGAGPFFLMENGYIKIHRKIRRWYGYKSMSRKALWLELLLRATHAPYTTLFKGKPTMIMPGSLVVGRKILAESINLSESWIEKILNEFEKMGQLRQQKSNRSRLISIITWSEYQNSDNREDNREDNRKTTERQQKDTKQEDKEYKEHKNIIYKQKKNDNFETVWSKYPKKLGKTAAERHFLKTVFNDQDLADINKALDNFLNSKQGKGDPQYIPHGSTWFNNWRDWVDYKEIETDEEKRQKLRKELGIE